MDINSSNQPEGQLTNEWYLFRDCNKFGPLTAKDIAVLLDKNQITKDHHVWHQTYNNWVAIKDVEAFKNFGFEVQIKNKTQNFIEDAKNQKAEVETKIREAHQAKKPGFITRVLGLFK